MALGVGLGIALVFANLFVSSAIVFIAGGCKRGSLRRTVEIDVGAAWMERFLRILRERAELLGFVATAQEWVFEQSGSVVGDLESHIHAKTHKRLTVQPDGSSFGARVRLTLEYVDPIFSDSGESAYRDAVLAYLSQTVNQMPTVPSRSFLAFTAFWGSIFVLVAVFLLPLLGMPPASIAGLVFVGSFVHGGAAIIAMIPMLRQPELIVGRGEALGAIVASLAAVALAVARWTAA